MHLSPLLVALIVGFSFSGSLRAQAVPLEKPSKTSEGKEAAFKSLRVKYEILLATQKYDELDKAARELCEQYLAGKISGDELVEQMHLMTPPEIKAALPDIVKWREARPNSYVARWLLGSSYLELAVKARGGKWAGETSVAQFAEMHRYAELARETLESSIPLIAKPYPSYRTLVATAAFLDGPDRAENYLQAATRTAPDNTGAYLGYFKYHTPRWGGSYTELEKLVDEARRAGKMSRRNLLILETDLLVWRGIDEGSLKKNPAGAADYYLAAYDRMPGRDNLRYLYWAAHSAKEAKQFDRAIDIYTKIIGEAKDEARAWFQRGFLYHEEKQDYPKAFKDYLVAAGMGDMYAQNNVGYYYMTGKAGTRDLKLAREYLNKSAAQGFEHAKEKLKLLDAQQ